MRRLSFVLTSLLVLSTATACVGPSNEEVCAHITELTLRELGDQLAEATAAELTRGCVDSFDGRRIGAASGRCALKAVTLGEAQDCVH